MSPLPSGFLQPILPANYPFKRVGIDFVGLLPTTKTVIKMDSGFDRLAYKINRDRSFYRCHSNRIPQPHRSLKICTLALLIELIILKKMCDNNKKQKRSAISLETKIIILDCLAKGERSTAIGKRYNLGESTIRAIKKMKRQ
ncbi:hypothetical protein LAZ67_1007439 [Cordylochernes scorpioides]|uniref:HTH psq-type domain-containing protein n=1 Tax=Cordylochernes scorpioides TaxID=51811 RepID=A0ABY6K037_9ARAC|nr:hypothetical protein LAZ67_1007439 [Cordylochernes scorpioides]